MTDRCPAGDASSSGCSSQTPKGNHAEKELRINLLKCPTPTAESSLRRHLWSAEQLSKWEREKLDPLTAQMLGFPPRETNGITYNETQCPSWEDGLVSKVQTQRPVFNPQNHIKKLLRPTEP